MTWPALNPSSRGPNLWVGDGVELADDVRIGANVVLHAGTIVARGVTLQDGVVLGKQPALAAHSTAPREPSPPLIVEAGATICSEQNTRR